MKGHSEGYCSNPDGLDGLYTGNAVEKEKRRGLRCIFQVEAELGKNVGLGGTEESRVVGFFSAVKRR